MAEGLELFDFISAEGNVLAVEAAEDDDVFVLVCKEAGEDTAVLSGKGVVFKAFPDFGVGVEAGIRCVLTTVANYCGDALLGCKAGLELDAHCSVVHITRAVTIPNLIQEGDG